MNENLKNLLGIMLVGIVVGGVYVTYKDLVVSFVTNTPQSTEFSGSVIKFENNVITMQGIFRAELIDNKMYNPKIMKVTFGPETKFGKTIRSLSATSSPNGLKRYTVKVHDGSADDFSEVVKLYNNVLIRVMTKNGSVGRDSLEAEEIHYAYTIPAMEHVIPVEN